jgi:hypothetical protein
MIRFGILTASLAGALAFALPASAATVTFTATLDGPSERPDAVATNGTGTATVTLDDVADTLSWSITYMQLSSAVTAAHFHGPADAGTTASPRITIPVADGGTSPITGSASISDAFQTELLAGLWYINLHTVNNTGGEIRGQVLRQADAGTDGGDGGTPDAPPDAPPDARDAGMDRDAAAGTGGGGTGGTGGTGTAGRGGGGTGGTGTAGRGGTGGGTAGAGGTGTAGRGGSSGRGGTGNNPPPADDDDGCGCRTVGDSGSAAGLIGLALGGLMLSRRMSQRRARRENERK